MIVIRCDAGAKMGMGHFYRQLALAEAAIERGTGVVFVTGSEAASLAPKVEAIGGTPVTIDTEPGGEEDAGELRRLAEEHDARAIVIDGYQFPTAYYEKLEGPWTLAAVDDIAHQSFPVDVLVNLNLGADSLHYDVPDSTRLLLGVDYTLLRKQFRDARPSTAPTAPERVRNVIVTLGGGDVRAESGLILDGLRECGFDGEVDVVLGKAAAEQDSVSNKDSFESFVCRVHTDVESMAGLIRHKDWAFSAGGGTNWELACLGVPMAQVLLADNQRLIIDGLTSLGVSVSLGDRESLTAEKVASTFATFDRDAAARQRMSEAGMDLIDGQGPFRVLSAILSE